MTKNDPVLQEALDLLASSRTIEAVNRLQRLANSTADDPALLAQIGLVLVSAGARPLARQILDKAWHLAPDWVELTLNLAVLLVDENLPLVAQERIFYTLSVSGDRSALLRLAAALAERPDEAEALLRRAILADPHAADNWRELARHRLERGQVDTALAAARQACSQTTTALEDWLMLALAAESAGETPIRLDALHKAAQLAPSDASIVCDYGRALLAAGQPKAALREFDRALTLDPDHVGALNNRGIALWRLRNLLEALTALKRALALAPDRANILTNLGVIHRELGQFCQATDCYRQAAALDPSYSPAFGNLAEIIAESGQIEAADLLYRQARALAPDDIDLQSQHLYALNSHPTLSGAALLAAYREVTDGWKPKPSPAAPVVSRERLRIGYVSPDFKEHPVSRISEYVLKGHDRRRIEVYCYAELEQPDSTTERMAIQADGWRFTSGLSDQALAERIQDDGIDILVDLAGHTRGHRLGVFARRPAPVCASWMIGTGQSTGLAAIDWYITDSEFLPPGFESAVGESGICYLPCAYAWTIPAIAPPAGPPPAARRGYITFGSQSRLIRLNAPVLECWAAILAAVPESHLHLNTGALVDPGLRCTLIDRFAQSGIAAERIELTYTDTLARMWRCYLDIDIALDPFPHNGGTVSFDALWMGVPLITLASRPPLGRFGSNFLNRIGLSELIAASIPEYHERAIALASDTARLACLRADLRNRLRLSPLTQPRELARHLDNAYHLMWAVAAGAVKAPTDPASGKRILTVG